MKRFLVFLIAVAAGLYLADDWLRPPATPAIASEPKQAVTWKASIRRGEFTITPLRTYALTARVLAKCAYPMGEDIESHIAPYDLVLGWGPFADAAFAKTVSITLGGRFYSWHVEKQTPEFSRIGLCSANNHVIPASDAVLKQIESLQVGDVVQLTGSLVLVRKANGWHWQSSLTREDTGDGGCEVFYVESVVRGEPPVVPATTLVSQRVGRIAFLEKHSELEKYGLGNSPIVVIELRRRTISPGENFPTSLSRSCSFRAGTSQGKCWLASPSGKIAGGGFRAGLQWAQQGESRLMLQIGSRSYRLVRNQSGLHVSLDPLERGFWDHLWRFEAHYVPDDADGGGEAIWAWEYWRFMINPMAGMKVADWRELARGSYLEGEGTESHFFLASLENQLQREAPVLDVALGDFSMTRREGGLFTCECDGEIYGWSGTEGKKAAAEFRLRDEIPLASVSVVVSLNASDPLAAAKAIAARELGVTEVARSHVDLYDPAVRRWKQENRVTLELPWR